MKIWILSKSRGDIDSTERLVKSAKSHRHHVQVYDPMDLHFEMSTKSSTIYCKSKKLTNWPDVVLPRLGWQSLQHGLRLAHFFESAGVTIINSAASLEKSTDKLRCLQALHKARLPIPASHFAASSQISEAHLLAGKSAHVFKLLHGSQGFGVTLQETRMQAMAQVDAYRNIPADFLAQEYIQESRGEDRRVFVIDGKVVAAMKRQAPKGEFRSNLQQGASAEPVTLKEAEKKLAVQACKALGLFYGGVDLRVSKRGALVIEANGCPGFEGITQVTGVPVADLFFEKIKSANI